MKKKSLVFLTAVLAVGLAVVGLPPLIQFLTSSDTSSVEEKPRYERVEAERYEVQFPSYINGNFQVVGGIYFGNITHEERLFINSFFTFEDNDLIYDFDDSFRFEFYVCLDGINASVYTQNHFVSQGEYGRYVISETQVADEPVAFTLEPIYEYVLVE